MADPPTGNDLSAKAVYRDPPALSYPPAHSELHASSSPPLTIETRSGLAEVTPQSKLGTEKEKKQEVNIVVLLLISSMRFLELALVYLVFLALRFHTSNKICMMWSPLI